MPRARRICTVRPLSQKLAPGTTSGHGISARACRLCAVETRSGGCATAAFVVGQAAEPFLGGDVLDPDQPGIGRVAVKDHALVQVMAQVNTEVNPFPLFLDDGALVDQAGLFQPDLG